MAFTITFKPSGRALKVGAGVSVLKAARVAGLTLSAPCAGLGVCGRCQVLMHEGSLQNLGPVVPGQLYLACQAYPASNLVVELPPAPAWQAPRLAARLPDFDFAPSLQAVKLKLEDTRPNDNLSDAERLSAAFKGKGFNKVNFGLPVLASLPRLARAGRLTAWLLLPEETVLALTPWEARPPLLLAVDLGTTSIWLQILDAASGEMLAESSELNPQSGEDVITRMLAAQNQDGRRYQQLAAAGAINELAASLLARLDADAERIALVALSANSVMTQLLLGIDCTPLRLAPYVPAARHYPLIKAREVGLAAAPNAPLMLMPTPGAYVGGDVVSGLLATGLGQSEDVFLFIDLGTNGEVALGNNQWLLAAAASAGPAFEGGGISCGMSYGPGAVYDVRLGSDLMPQLAVVGNVAPRGLCGSGLLALAAELLLHGVITPNGRFNRQLGAKSLAKSEHGLSYVISRETGIALTEPDLQNLMMAKAAVYAACACLMELAGVCKEGLGRVVLAGSFGASLNLEQAISLGLLPELPQERFSYAGNSSLAGAKALMLNRHCREQVFELANRITNVELSTQPSYMRQYTAALFFPHTQAESLFPCALKRLRGTTRPE